MNIKIWKQLMWWSFLGRLSSSSLSGLLDNNVWSTKRTLPYQCVHFYLQCPKQNWSDRSSAPNCNHSTAGLRLVCCYIRDLSKLTLILLLLNFRNDLVHVHIWISPFASGRGRTRSSLIGIFNVCQLYTANVFRKTPLLKKRSIWEIQHEKG